MTEASVKKARNVLANLSKEGGQATVILHLIKETQDLYQGPGKQMLALASSMEAYELMRSIPGVEYKVRHCGCFHQAFAHGLWDLGQ